MSFSLLFQLTLKCIKRIPVIVTNFAGRQMMSEIIVINEKQRTIKAVAALFLSTF